MKLLSLEHFFLRIIRPLFGRKLIIAFIIIALSFSFSGAPSINAQGGPVDYYVTDLSDSNDGVCDANCSLREAININNASGTPSEGRIHFNVSGTIILYSALPAIAHSTIIYGLGTEELSISGNHANRIFTVNSSTQFVVQDLTIQDGFSSSSGGAIYINSGALVLFNRTMITGNTANAGGGAIYNAGGNIELRDSTVRLNSAVVGAGISNNSGGTLTITQSQIGNNTANTVDSEGGGIFSSSGTVTISDSVLIYNRANIGAGLFIHQNSNATITRTHFESNTASGYGGGGIFTWNAVTISDSLFTRNTSSAYGGAIYQIQSASASTTITNTSFRNNTAIQSGGGLYITNAATIRNTTFVGNAANTGGAIYRDAGTATIYNSIFASNTTTNCANGVTDGGYNLEYPSSSCEFSNHALLADPMLDSMANNSGQTLTLALQAGSPAIDAIPNGINECGTTLLTDQRGMARPQDGNGDGVIGCDVGAYEAQTGFPTAFSEEFTSSTLDPQWEVVAYNGARVYGFSSPANHFDLTSNPGHLRYLLDPMTHNDGFINGFQPSHQEHSSYDHDPGLELRRRFSGLNWDLDAKLNTFLPPSNGRSLDFRVYFGDGQAGTYFVEFRRVIDIGTNATYAALVEKTGTELSTKVPLASGTLSTNAGETYFLRVERRRGSLTVKQSADGVTWETFFSYDVGFQLDSQEQRVVLTGLSWFNSVGSYGDWDYIRLTPSAPGLVELTLPSETTNFQSPNYAWQEVLGASFHEIWLSGPTGRLLNEAYNTASTCEYQTCNYHPSVVLHNGTYHWWMRAKSPFGDGPWGTGLEFTVIGQTPGTVNLILPTEVGTNPSPEFRWTDDANSQWYYLWISGSNGKVLDQWYDRYGGILNCNGSECWITPPITLTNGTYTYWVQGWGGGVYGPWSNGKDFVVTSQSPSTVTLLAPNSNTPLTNPTFQWTDDLNSQWYYLWVSDATTNSKVIDQWYDKYGASITCSIGQCSVTPTLNLALGHTYQFWVQGWGGGVYGPWSNGMQFTITSGSSPDVEIAPTFMPTN